MKTLFLLPALTLAAVSASAEPACFPKEVAATGTAMIVVPYKEATLVTYWCSPRASVSIIVRPDFKPPANLKLRGKPLELELRRLYELDGNYVTGNPLPKELAAQLAATRPKE